jgi:hypothetical protein
MGTKIENLAYNVMWLTRVRLVIAAKNAGARGFKRRKKSLRMSTSAAILVPYQNLERLAGALNGLPDSPRTPSDHQPPVPVAWSPGFGLQLRGVRLHEAGQRNVDPWAPILALFAALSASVRAEEEKQAQEQRRRAPLAHDFKAVRALRFGETALIPPRPPGTKQQATDYLMRWIAEQWSPVVPRVVKRCELCSRWFVDRSKPHHAKRCAACRRRYWTRPRRRASLERSAHLGRVKRPRKRRR